MSDYKFKVGDRVRALRNGGIFSKGDTGKVVDEDDMPHVRWDETDEVECECEGQLELVKGGKQVKDKGYPKKFYAQRCMTNDDPTDLRIQVDPKDLNMDYPMLEITNSRGKFKIRQVALTIKETITAKEV